MLRDLIEKELINAREGAWVKVPAPSMGAVVKRLAISLVIFAVVLFLHPYFTGVPAIPSR